MRMQHAFASDKQLLDWFEQVKGSVAQLDLTRDELAKLIPDADGGQDQSLNTAVVEIRQSLDEMTSISEKKTELLTQGQAMITQVNAIE